MGTYADPLDKASELEEINNQTAISSMKRYTRPTATGYCLHCEEDLETENQLFCDARCAKRWSLDNEH